ncbi:set domain-containing protein [Chrysochromulina tobinii]|uniref:Set domain-containing protein n=1 Tax=Chrysochromulina tobinii TaxID=1460289 RepID=A0A0M0JWY5_9EUKA|nr:set domain-containing protein [Chrysochromulina tobinii]|eukprot:KOO30837.1 set domain-containing protein [Chrysochromulina sp. CCMP291]
MRWCCGPTATVAVEPCTTFSSSGAPLRAPSGCDGTPHSSTFRVVTVPYLGRCLVAARPMAPGEVIISEEPILAAEYRAGTADREPTPSEKNSVAQASRNESILRTYCDSPALVREAVLDAMSTIEYDVSDAGTQVVLEQVDAIRKAHKWAAAHSAHDLATVLMAFKLNAYGFGGGNALFPTLRLMEHSCESNVIYAPRPSDMHAGRGVAVALRAIKEGERERLSTSYHDCVVGRRMRRRILQHKKQFVCRCARCEAPDWNTQVC